MNREHHYVATVTWTGNKGQGTSHYRAFDRSYTISADYKPDLLGSSDPSFRGDKTKYNPEELLLASLSSCHMLWYLHLCSEAGIKVMNYSDRAMGIMAETPNGGGRFSLVVLNPVVIISDESRIEKAKVLHQKANELCFIANSVNFSVEHEARFNLT